MKNIKKEYYKFSKTTQSIVILNFIAPVRNKIFGIKIKLKGNKANLNRIILEKNREIDRVSKMI